MLPTLNTVVIRVPIPGFPGYEAGDDGSIWSQFRQVKRGKGGLPVLGQVWHRMNPGRNHGYLRIILYRDGPNYRSVHRLILESFVGPCPPKHECCHRNGNRSDNRLSNIYWGTSQQNHEDCRGHGTLPVGSKKPNAKLTEVLVLEIKGALLRGVGCTQLAREYKVSPGTIYFIKKGTYWKHV